MADQPHRHYWAGPIPAYRDTPGDPDPVRFRCACGAVYHDSSKIVEASATLGVVDKGRQHT